MQRPLRDALLCIADTVQRESTHLLLNPTPNDNNPGGNDNAPGNDTDPASDNANTNAVRVLLVRVLTLWMRETCGGQDDSLFTSLLLPTAHLITHYAPHSLVLWRSLLQILPSFLPDLSASDTHTLIHSHLIPLITTLNADCDPPLLSALSTVLLSSLLIHPHLSLPYPFLLSLSHAHPSNLPLTVILIIALRDNVIQVRTHHNHPIPLTHQMRF